MCPRWRPVVFLAGAVGASGCANLLDLDDYEVATAVPTLDRQGLLARYYLDEAALGTEPMAANDASGNQVHLPLSYDDGVMSWFESPAGRGLSWSQHNSNDGACAPVTGTVLSKLRGAQTGTLEVVAQITDASNFHSRLLHIDSVDASGAFTLGVLGPITNDIPMVLSIADRSAATWHLPTSPDLRVFHLVFDSTKPDPAERAVLYVDGVRQAPPPDVDVEQWEALDVDVDLDSFCIGNRAIGERSIHGAIAYGAVYTEAFSASRVHSHAARLRANNDRAPEP